MKIKTLSCLLLFLILGGCGEDIEDPIPPETPQWTEKSYPDSERETGIDAVSEDDYIFLSWMPNPDEDIEGYHIFRAEGNIDSNYQKIADVNIYSLGGVDTAYLDMDVLLNQYYYYYLRAYDQACNRSLRSDTICYQLVQKVDLLSPLESIQEIKPLFRWYDFSTLASEYVIKLFKLNPKEVIWIYRFSRPNYGDFLQSITYDSDAQAREDTLRKGVTYQWCIDAIAAVDNYGKDISGSESFWGYFTRE